MTKKILYEAVPVAERYVAFYTSPCFWAGQPVVPTDLEGRPDFETLMSDWAFSHKCQEYTLAICRDGLILLRIPRLQVSDDQLMRGNRDEKGRLWAEYLEYINCLYLLLDSSAVKLMNYVPGYFELRAITRHDTIMLYYEDDKQVQFSLMDRTLYGHLTRSPFFDRLPQTYPLGFVDEFRFKNGLRATFTQDILGLVQREFSMVAQDSWLRNRMSTITKSIGEYRDGNYGTSLVLAWFVIESIITQRWTSLVDSKNDASTDGDAKRISRERRKVLLKSQDYTASVVTNFLELSGVLPFETFRKIDRTRKCRNDIAHSDPDYVCTAQHSREAIELALALTTEGSSLDIQPNLGFWMFGP